MLLGNCLIGLHEQTRLQPNIAAAIDAPVDVSATEGLLARAIDAAAARVRREFERCSGPPAKSCRLARAIWQHIATAAAMHISMPDDQRIPLGEDVERQPRPRASRPTCARPSCARCASCSRASAPISA